MMVMKYLDYDKLVKKFIEANYYFGERYAQVEDVKVLLSEVTIRKIESMMKRIDYPISKGVMFVANFKLPNEGNYPFNDKIILFTKNSCWQDDITFEINIKDIEVI